MIALDIGEAEFTDTQAVMVSRFVGRHCALDPQLVSPMRVLWTAYKAWAAACGHVPSAEAMRTVFELSPWARVEERPGRGRIRTVVHGVGLRARVSGPAR